MSNEIEIPEVKKVDLPASLKKLYDALSSACWEGQSYGAPVTIEELHKTVFGEVVEGERRHMQQRLGAYITKLNRRLKGHGEAVKPGDLKGTYVLTSTR